MAAMRELGRLLRPGGVMIVTVPYCAPPHQTPFFFSSGLSDQWFETAARRYSLEIDEIRHNGDVWAYLLQEMKRARTCIQNRLVRVLYFGACLPVLLFFALVASHLKQREPDYIHLGHFVVLKKKL
jgi:SAM-dependent methyltransferase